MDHVNGVALSSTSNSLRRLSKVKPSFIDATYTVYDDGSHNLGILQNNCHLFLTCITLTDVNSKSQCSSPPSAKKESYFYALF